MLSLLFLSYFFEAVLTSVFLDSVVVSALRSPVLTEKRLRKTPWCIGLLSLVAPSLNIREESGREKGKRREKDYLGRDREREKKIIERRKRL